MSADAIKQPRFLVSRVAVVLIMLIWIVAAVTKFYDLPAFMDTINKHGVIPAEYQWLGMALGPVELVIAVLLVFVAGSELRKLFGRAVLLLSLAAILGFAWYLTKVPDAVLQESGCGCMGKSIASGMETSVRTVAAVRTGLLIALHAVAMVGPVVSMRRYRRAVAASSSASA